LPASISEPAQRDTIFKVLTGTFSSDTHPPGYYLAMFPWTRLAGGRVAGPAAAEPTRAFVHGSLFVIAIVGQPTFTSCSNLEGGFWES
jgi:hypothetical protein